MYSNRTPHKIPAQQLRMCKEFPATILLPRRFPRRELPVIILTKSGESRIESFGHRIMTSDHSRGTELMIVTSPPPLMKEDFPSAHYRHSDYHLFGMSRRGAVMKGRRLYYL